MNVLRWFAERLMPRNRALSLYRRGMVKAKRKDHQGAINDYTQSMLATGSNPDVVAMVLYNRALVYVAAGEESKGADDLRSVLAMSESLVNVKTMARQKLARMDSRAPKT